MAATLENLAVATGLEKISFHSNPQKRKCKKAKWLSVEALQIAEKRSNRQQKKGKIYPSEYRVSKNSKER